MKFKRVAPSIAKTSIEMHGDDVVEKQAKVEYIKRIIKQGNDHFKKQGYKTMTPKEFNDLFKLN